MKVSVKRVRNFSPNDSMDFCKGFDFSQARHTLTGVISEIRSDFLNKIIDRGFGNPVTGLTESGEYFCPITSYVTGEAIFIIKFFFDADGLKMKLFDFDDPTWMV